jgi:hypothetical protein
MDLNEISCGDMDWTHLAQDMVEWWTLVKRR